MKSNRKVTLIILPIICFYTTSFSQSLLKTKWQLISMKDSKTGESIKIDSIQNATLEFNTDTTYLGYNGCNSYYGKYRDLGSNKINMESPTSTKKLCVGGTWGNGDKIIKDFKNVTNYKLTGESLLIYTSNDKIVRLKKYSVEIDKRKAQSLKNSSEPFLFVKEMPKYPEGDDALYAFINKNLIVPKSFTGKGQVYVSFIVEKSGKITNIKVEKKLCLECDNEAARVFKLMPKWIPGKQDGELVRVKLTYPVRFNNAGK